ncbi:UMP-CMP kinase, putative [Entamoeba histolytica HM-1:IMSS-B]|uniref:UMP-CMP kinase, putative n=6 Tax=Entamoeba histolytica TaxID=5759 RepID=A0A8U0WPT6_ENTH1|eukprot:XP_652359.1 UMP-CMP kinase, putative [Entamoeba histolytica HM-1:IMSS]
MSLSDKHVLFCLGGPGAGKGTQCQKIINKYPITHLSAGDLLRAEVKREGSQNGQLIQTLIKEGKIVPAAVTVELLLNAIRNDEHKVFIIDGFPRNAENKEAWFLQANKVNIDTALCVFIDVSEETMINRIHKRSVNSGRVDDNDDSLMKRFRTYKSETLPVIESFENENKLLRVSGEGSVDDIFNKIDSSLAKFFADNHILL